MDLRQVLHVPFVCMRSQAAGLAVLLLIAAAHGGTTTYTYDVHGRLVSATLPNGADQTVVSLTYDNAGNRTRVLTGLYDSTPPPVPINLTAAAADWNRINLAWAVTSTPPDFANFRVYRGGSLVGTPTATSFSDTPLQGNTTYNYRVSAQDNATNESGQSNQAAATTPPQPDTTPPSVPTGLVAQAVTGNWVNLTWNGSSDNPGGSGLAGYQVFRNGSWLANSTTTNQADTTVASSVTYQYQVRAYDAATPGPNYSALSSPPVSVTTPDNIAPSVPTSVTATQPAGQATVTVTWGASTDNSGGTGVQGYKIFRNGTLFAQGLFPLHVEDNTVAANTTYNYHVSAYDGASPANESAQSNPPAQVTTAMQWIPITDDYGNITTAESAWYQINTTCGPPDITFNVVCVQTYKKKYGNLATIWQMWFDYYSACNFYSGTAGHQQVGCRIDANSSTYHQ